MITLYMLQGGNRPRPPHRPISLGSSQSSGHGCSRCIAARRCSERCRGGVYRLWAPPVPDRPSRLRFSRPFSCRCIACDSGARIQTPFDCNCSFRGVRTLRTWPAIFRTKGRPRGCCASSGRRCSGTQHHGGSAEFHGAWVDGIFAFVGELGCPLMVVVMAKMVFEAGGSARRNGLLVY
jgi:hypothetical protein